MDTVIYSHRGVEKRTCQGFSSPLSPHLFFGGIAVYCVASEWVTTPRTAKENLQWLESQTRQAAFYQHLQAPQNSIYDSSVKGQVRVVASRGESSQFGPIHEGFLGAPNSWMDLDGFTENPIYKWRTENWGVPL